MSSHSYPSRIRRWYVPNATYFVTSVTRDRRPLFAEDANVDLLRIKIWDRDTDTVIYDSLLGAAEDADPTTEIGGGNIVIHSRHQPWRNRPLRLPDQHQTG